MRRVVTSVLLQPLARCSAERRCCAANANGGGSDSTSGIDLSNFSSAMSVETCTPATDWSGRYTHLDPATTAAGSSSHGSGATIMTDADVSKLVDGLQAKQRRALARAVTMIESANPAHTMAVARVLRETAARRRPLPSVAASDVSGPGSLTRRPRQRRIAISGPPGAGKSCFIEALGCHIADQGLTVGVLAVDPSSAVTGGSILGDKTRMEKLGSHPNAFIRPSPSKGHLGGVTAKCWETLEIYEAANFDVTLVETVGVGQSETEASNLTDLFVLLVPPAAGDELQGVKKGIVEMADIVIVTKADGPRETLADLAKSFYQRAVMYSSTNRRGDQVDCTVQKPVMTVSSENGLRIAEAWTTINELWLRHAASGELDRRRSEQRLQHFKAFLNHEVTARTWAYLEQCRETTKGSSSGSNAGNAGGASLREVLERYVSEGRMTPREAGNAALDVVFRGTV